MWKNELVKVAPSADPNEEQIDIATTGEMLNEVTESSHSGTCVCNEGDVVSYTKVRMIWATELCKVNGT